jgi:transposase InsO family protein
MAYTNDPRRPTVRGQAVALVRKGWSSRKVARHFGFSQSVIVKWVAKARIRGYGKIPTRSSRPMHHPHELTSDVVRAIVRERLKRNQCAEVIQIQLKDQGIAVSLSSIKRTLERRYLVKKRSPWKKWHHSAPRPETAQPGALVQVDTIHLMVSRTKRIYVFTLLDVYSRWAYAKATEKATAGASLRFVKEAQKKAPFLFDMLQTDHGPEFGKYFVRMVQIRHRHSRVRRPNDNGHLERFNRTIQEQCLSALPKDVRTINRKLPAFLRWYNEERPHLGIQLKKPMQLIPSY